MGVLQTNDYKEDYNEDDHRDQAAAANDDWVSSKYMRGSQDA